MKTVNIHEAKTHLSKLVEEASKGEPFVIAKAGKPVVKGNGSQRSNRFSGTSSRVHGRAGFGTRRLRPNGSRRDRTNLRWGWCMKLLLDTHLLLWAAGEPSRLSEEACKLIDDRENELLFSAASLW